jgi:hypothetical protein
MLELDLGYGGRIGTHGLWTAFWRLRPLGSGVRVKSKDEDSGSYCRQHGRMIRYCEAGVKREMGWVEG